MYYASIPLGITPRPEDAERLAERRAHFAEKLRAHAAREVRIVCGDAHDAVIEAVLRDKYLSRCLAGPRPLFKVRAR